MIGGAATPQLQCSQLGNPVFDVVEGHFKQVQLALPLHLSDVFQARPVAVHTESLIKVQPQGGSTRSVEIGVAIDFVLERINGGYPSD